MAEHDPEWLGDLRWRGYPRLAPQRDIAGEEPVEGVPPPPRPRKAADARVETLARENEALRAKIDALGRLSVEFERRLSETASAYEGAALESESARRDAELERERLSGALSSAQAELARRDARDAAREAELALERGRRDEAEKSLLEARRRALELEEALTRSRAQASQAAGQLEELRRQADAQNERLLRAKALTDEDVRLLRLEMREFLAKFHRIQEDLGENPKP
jgi:chromosome segregation ATPase